MRRYCACGLASSALFIAASVAMTVSSSLFLYRLPQAQPEPDQIRTPPKKQKWL